MSPKNFQPPRARKKAYIGNAHSVIPRSAGRGSWQAKDYTKYIQWTPLKIAIFAAFVTSTYSSVVVAVALHLGLFATIPLIVLALIIPLIFWGLHWLAKQNF